MNRIQEEVAVIAVLDPDAYTAATYTTDEIDMRYWREVMFIILNGAMTTSATLDFSVKGGAASNPGSHSTTVTGKSITQLTEAGTDSDKQAIVVVTAEECAAQSLRYIEGSLVVAVAAVDCGVVVVGRRARYQPAQDFDLASVDEIVD